ncbi:MAG: cupin domain-containing protein [Gemmataceae bacterium]|nr:cupin domain-containing protein [Gemmataceae bacterium]
MSVLKPGGGRMVAVAGDVYTLKLAGADTGGRCSVLEFVVPPGGGPPPHTHTREGETFYVTGGELTFTVGGETLVVGAGGFAHPPRGVPHSFTNKGATPAKAVVVVSPAGLEEMFFETGTAWDSTDRFPGPPTPADIERLKAAAPKYGIVLGPPPGGHA